MGGKFYKTVPSSHRAVMRKPVWNEQDDTLVAGQSLPLRDPMETVKFTWEGIPHPPTRFDCRMGGRGKDQSLLPKRILRIRFTYLLIGGGGKCLIIPASSSSSRSPPHSPPPSTYSSLLTKTPLPRAGGLLCWRRAGQQLFSRLSSW